jgi:GT2 family glycosyltransferase
VPKGCSVVIATIGRREKKLKACLDSLFGQTHEELEVLCVVPEAKLLEGIDERVRIIETKDINGSRNKNIGIRKARHDFVALTDDDCIAEKDWISNIMRDFEEHDVAAVCGSVYLTNQPMEDVKKPEEKKLFRKSETFVPPWEIGTGGCICMKKEAIEDIGFYDERLGPGSRLHSAEDMDVIHRLVSADYTMLRDPSAVIYHDKTEDHLETIARFYRYRLGLGAFFFKIRRSKEAKQFFFDNFLVGEIRNLKADLFKGRTREIPRPLAAFAGALFGFVAYSILPKKPPKSE